MRTPIFIFLISFLARFTNASVGAGVPELYAYYSAYQMQFYAYGKENINIGKGCPGSGESPCTLKEFVRYTMLGKQQKTFDKGYSKLPATDQAFLDTQDPDVNEIERVLHTTWDDWPPKSTADRVKFYTGSYDGQKLLVGYPTNMGPKFNEFLKSITDEIQNTRQKVAGGTAKVNSVDTWFNRVIDGFRGSHENRIADQSEGLVRDLTSDVWGISTVKTESITLSNGRVYSRIDTAATMAASGIAPGSEEESKMLTEYASWTNLAEDTTGFSAEKKKSINHQKLLNSVAMTVSRITSTPDC